MRPPPAWGICPTSCAKLERARDIRGTRFIHVIAPCPTGWGCPEADMVDVARDIVDCGLWYLAEYEGPQLSAAGRAVQAQQEPAGIHQR